MSKQSEREEFLVLMSQEGISLSIARKLLRLSATLTRLAEAQCNGDWPANNGEKETKECEDCGLYWHPSAFKRYFGETLCVNCRNEKRLAAIVEPLGITPIFNGDPRGCVVKLKVPSGKTNDWGREGICVP